MHGSKNVKFGRITSYGLKGPGLGTRWGLDFPDPSRSAPRPTQPAVQRMPGVKRPRLGVYHPAPSGAGVAYGHSYSSSFQMCLLGRLRDMKQMYQLHGVTFPKTWHVSTNVRNGTYLFAAWMKFCTTVYPLNALLCFALLCFALLSSEQFADSIFSLLRIYCIL
jgi:hypothetical protein